jgi:hypothetical protein
MYCAEKVNRIMYFTYKRKHKMTSNEIDFLRLFSEYSEFQDFTKYRKKLFKQIIKFEGLNLYNEKECFLHLANRQVLSQKVSLMLLCTISISI